MYAIKNLLYPEIIMNKKIMNNELSIYIDNNIEINEELCWNKVLQQEALLLKPNQNPNYCLVPNCNAIICNFCCNKTNNGYIIKVSENVSLS